MSVVLAARWRDTEFTGDDDCNAFTAASYGKIYYVICAYKIDWGAQMLSCDPATDRVTRLAERAKAGVRESWILAEP